ncbi:hypothetical protein Syun_001306 [Stephania yunnanensis]|uniref:Uncharacterized protein n=1 Tax=Stephania yunnanensis TaxID=152371 RepID=A0AAP0QAS2_9MAGN
MGSGYIAGGKMRYRDHSASIFQEPMVRHLEFDAVRGFHAESPLGMGIDFRVSTSQAQPQSPPPPPPHEHHLQARIDLTHSLEQ